jgi:hypothetical protein
MHRQLLGKRGVVPKPDARRSVPSSARSPGPHRRGRSLPTWRARRRRATLRQRGRRSTTGGPGVGCFTDQPCRPGRARSYAGTCCHPHDQTDLGRSPHCHRRDGFQDVHDCSVSVEPALLKAPTERSQNVLIAVLTMRLNQAIGGKSPSELSHAIPSRAGIVEPPA